MKAHLDPVRCGVRCGTPSQEGLGTCGPMPGAGRQVTKTWSQTSCSRPSSRETDSTFLKGPGQPGPATALVLRLRGTRGPRVGGSAGPGGFSEQAMLSESGGMSKAEPGGKQTNKRTNKQTKGGRTLSQERVPGPGASRRHWRKGPKLQEQGRRPEISLRLSDLCPARLLISSRSCPGPSGPACGLLSLAAEGNGNTGRISWQRLSARSSPTH